MKTQFHALYPLIGAFMLMALGHAAGAQTGAAVALSRNGELLAENLEPGTSATVEWAPKLSGPWSSSWEALGSVTVRTDGTFHVSVPMFYRVRGVPANPDPARLAWIPPGTFVRGSPASEPGREALVATTGYGDERQHQVTLTRGFWMGKFEVTQEEFEEIMGVNPSSFAGQNLPVETVTWFESVDYCERLTARERVAGRLPDGYVYRLPTEAEWEYACRAGTTTVFYSGDEMRSGMANFNATEEYSLTEGGVVANLSGVFLERTTPVGSYEPNAWGLYDMHGNVRERCYDGVDHYPSGPVTDPVVRPRPDWVVIERGGSWRGSVIGLRSAHRDFHYPDFRHFAYGFRIVLAHPIE